MSAQRTTLLDVYAEQATALLRATLTDTDGVTALPNASGVLLGLTLTLYEASTGALVNACLGRDVLGTHGGTVYDTLQTDASGNTYNLEVRLDAADMVFVTSGPTEWHVALLAWWWGTTRKDGKHEVAFQVANMAKVP